MNTLDLDQILPKLRKEMAAILRERPVMLAYLHGSVVDGSVLPTSDVDIALVFAPESDFTAYERMLVEFEIAGEVENRCGIKEADVRSIDHIPITIQGKITLDGEIIFSRDEEFRVDYEVYARSRYFDYLPIKRMVRKEIFNHVRKEGLTYGST